MDRAVDGASTDEGRSGRARQQDCSHRLGHHDPRREIPSTEAVAGSVRDASRRIGNTHWRGHDDVMQTRSFRGSGEPVWVSARLSASFRLGPDPRRALGPAATPAASTGRTRDRTRPMLQAVRKFLPGRRPHVTAGSTGRRNTGVKSFCWGFKLQGLTGSFV